MIEFMQKKVLFIKSTELKSVTTNVGKLLYILYSCKANFSQDYFISNNDVTEKYFLLLGLYNCCFLNLSYKLQVCMLSTIDFQH